MLYNLLTPRRFHTMLSMVFLLGLGTLAILALGVLLLASLLLKTLFDTIASMFQSLNDMLTAGGPFLRFFFLVFLLFLLWRATPTLLRLVRREWTRFQDTVAFDFSAVGEDETVEPDLDEDEGSLGQTNTHPFAFTAEENRVKSRGSRSGSAGKYPRKTPTALRFTRPTGRTRIVVLPVTY